MRTRAVIATEYARAQATAITIFTLGAATGGEIETDPRSSDFLKIRFGKIRIDPLSGLAQIGTMLGRLGTGETKTPAKGKVVPIRGEKAGYGGSTGASVIGTFLRSKLHPSTGTALN